MPPPDTDLLVVGAGPAGLTAALEARRLGLRVVVLEADPHYVGGISRTVRSPEGNRFDIGGHRFFSKNPLIVRWWRDRLPGDFIRVARRSRILYRGKYYKYPLSAWNAFRNLGAWTSLRCVLSYARARVFPVRPETSFADWVSNRFGRRLFDTFFRSYTEKVWGIPTGELSARWAAQRIKGLSLATAVLRAIFPRRGAGDIKTLIESFDYPRLGPGQMWEKAAADLRASGGEVLLGWRVTRIVHASGRVARVDASAPDGRSRSWTADHFILSMPLRETVLACDPPLPAEAAEAARGLRYRDFITVALVIRGPNPFPDNWLYIHDSAVRAGRIQNFFNWSPDMVAEPGSVCLGLEYFCFRDDALWNLPDSELVALASEEIVRLGFARAESIVRGSVVRMERAYPMYADDHEGRVAIIRAALAEFANLQVVGRNGMHKYNNQDHSMLTAMLAVENIARPGRHDVWRVNSDAEYHEEQRAAEPASHSCNASESQRG